MTNTNKIESIGITALREFLDKSKMITYDIYEKDKNPIWDGEINVYKNEKHSNDNFIGKIPIQLKSSQVKISKRNQTKFQMKVCDLEAYKNDGGVFLFYVNIVSANKRIFFNSLMPLDLHQLITKAGKQKRIGVEVSKLNDLTELEHKCLDFFFHRKNQIGIDDYAKNLEGVKNLSIHFTTNKGKNPIEELISKTQYVYIKDSPKSKTFDSVMKLDIGVGGPEKKSIKVGNTEYYSTVERVFNKDTVIWKFGAGITIFVDQYNKMEIYSNPVGTIEQRVKDTSFFLELMDKRSLNIDNNEIALQDTKEKNYDQVIKSLQSYLCYLENIVQVFNFFNSDYNLLDLEAIKTDVERKSLNFMIDHIVRKKKGYNQNLMSGKYKLVIGNISFMIFICPDKAKERILINDLSIFEEELCGSYDNNRSEENCVRISPYIFLEVDDLIDCINLPVEKIYKGLIKIEHSLGYDNNILHLVFKIIKAYDKTKRNEFYEYALKLLDWIAEANFIEKDVVRINKLQVKKRIANLTTEDLEYLINFKSQKKDDPDYLICIYVLLGDKDKFNDLFTEMQIEKQVEFKEYPIYYLIKENLC